MITIMRVESKKVMKMTLISIFISLFVMFVISLFIYTHTIHGKEYNNAISVIKANDLIGLNFEQCYNTLYTEHWLNDIYAKLQNEKGTIHNISKDIDYSYYALFFACYAKDGSDGLLKEYLYKLYFDENQQVVYVELVPCKA